MEESWVNSAERIGADLHLELSGPGGRRAALIRALRDAVADAYAELVAEGWLTARQGSGTRVAGLARLPR